MRRTSTYSTPRSRNACSGRSPRPDHALRADRAVELVLDLQQAGGELAVLVAGRECRSPRRPDTGCVSASCSDARVALEAVVADRERRLRVALVAEAPHAQRRRVRQIERVLAQALELVRAACDEARAHRRRGAEQIQQQPRDDAGSCGSARSTLRWTLRQAARSCSGCPRSSACACRSDATGPIR